MAIMPPNEIELALLSLFYRTESETVDRTGSVDQTQIDPVSGLAISANSLAPRYAWRSGTELALDALYNPKLIARSMIYRTDTINKTVTPLTLVPPDTWTDSEAGAVRQLEREINAVLVRMKHNGMINPNPTVGEDGTPMPLRDEEHPFLFRCTYKGLQEARKRVRGTRYEHGPTSTWDVMTPEMKAKSKVQWAEKRDK